MIKYYLIRLMGQIKLKIADFVRVTNIRSGPVTGQHYESTVLVSFEHRCFLESQQASEVEQKAACSLRKSGDIDAQK